MARNFYVCGCRDCKRAKKQGLILGSRCLRHLRGGFQSDPNRDFGDSVRVSDYVSYPRWEKGWRIKRPKQKEQQFIGENE